LAHHEDYFDDLRAVSSRLFEAELQRKGNLRADSVSVGGTPGAAPMINFLVYAKTVMQVANCLADRSGRHS
jgi:hypothetical protein